jgi:hypothetical protein
MALQSRNVESYATSPGASPNQCCSCEFTSSMAAVKMLGCDRSIQWPGLCCLVEFLSSQLRSPRGSSPSTMSFALGDCLASSRTIALMPRTVGSDAARMAPSPSLAAQPRLLVPEV